MNEQQRTALELALEALETHVPYVYKDRGYAPITAIREALEQPAVPRGYKQEQSGFFSREAMKKHSDGHVTQPSVSEHLEPVAKPFAWANTDDLCADTAFRWCEIGDHKTPVYTTPPQRKPLFIGKESAEFAEWFNAVWLGDGEQGETIPTSGKEYDGYLSQYTLAFGAWMAAKEAAHSIKE